MRSAREQIIGLVENLKSKYTEVKFVNLSISFLRIFGLSCSSFTDMCVDLAVLNSFLFEQPHAGFY